MSMREERSPNQRGKCLSIWLIGIDNNVESNLISDSNILCRHLLGLPPSSNPVVMLGLDLAGGLLNCSQDESLPRYLVEHMAI